MMNTKTFNLVIIKLVLVQLNIKRKKKKNEKINIQ